MSIDMLPNNAGPEQRKMAAEYAARRARLFNSSPAPVKREMPKPRVLIAPPKPIAPPTPEPADLPYATSSVRSIINAVCAKHGIGRADLVSRSRRPHLVLARQECCYELRTAILIDGRPISWPRIARQLGFTDHTTALYGYRQHAKLLAGLSTVSTVVTGTIKAVD